MIAPPKPPAHDELEALIKDARARQLRRRLFGAAAVAIAAALGLGVYAITIGGRDHGKVTGGSANAGTPPCRSAQLSTTAGLNGATGTMAGVAVLTNTSGITCSLPATPPAVSIFWRGKQLPARQKRMNGEKAAPVSVLAPHAKAVVHMDWANWCGRPSEGSSISPTLRLRFGGLQVAARAHVMTLPRCGSPGGSTIYVSPLLAN